MKRQEFRRALYGKWQPIMGYPLAIPGIDAELFVAYSHDRMWEVYIQVTGIAITSFWTTMSAAISAIHSKIAYWDCPNARINKLIAEQISYNPQLYNGIVLPSHKYRCIASDQAPIS